MRLPKFKLKGKGTSHLKFRKHKKTMQHIEKEAVTLLKEELKPKEKAKKTEAKKTEGEKPEIMEVDDEEAKNVKRGKNLVDLTEAEKQEKLAKKMERKKERREGNKWKKYTGMGYNTNRNGPRAI
jgi:hypothetical protein